MRIFDPDHRKDIYDVYASRVSDKADPIVYNRKEKNFLYQPPFSIPEDLKFFVFCAKYPQAYCPTISFISIAGEPVIIRYDVKRDLRSSKYVTEEENVVDVSDLDQPEFRLNTGIQNFKNYVLNKNYARLIECHKKHNTPLIMFRSLGWVGINPTIPPCVYKVKSAGEIYQQIESFIANNLGEQSKAPDKMTDKEKVLSHGFDLKNSFRKKNR
jgi:hypothetical protein